MSDATLNPIDKPNASTSWDVTERALGFARSVVRYMAGLLMTLLLGSLQAYKLLISPLLGSRCRFHPSCSVYAQQSLHRFGPFKGCALAVARLLRCGPWHSGGVDEVPATFSVFQRSSAATDTTPIAQPQCSHQDTFSPSRR